MTIKFTYQMVAAALCASAVTLLAAERATFILTDGERLSGEVVFHTDARTNIRADKNEFNLKLSSGVEMPIPFDHVVMIDFVGGQPRPEELSALPDRGHLLTRRDGTSTRGRLVDMIAGTTVRWQSEGRQSDIAISDVRRIFLNLDRVRDMYNVTAPAATAAATPAPTPSEPITPLQRGGRGAPISSEPVTVRGALDWTDTGLTVRRGQVLRFSATGQVYYTRDNVPAVGPDGRGAANPQFPVGSLPVGALIGKVGPNGRPFAIGANTSNITMPAAGRLMLGINDNEFEDNSGSFRVVVGR